MSDNRNDPKDVGVKYQQNGGIAGMDPSVDMVSPFYESLPGAPAPNNTKQQLLNSASGRQASISEEEAMTMSAHNPVYGNTGKPILPKKNTKKQYTVNKTPVGAHQTRGKSNLLAYGMVIFFMAVILLIAVAALIISLFVLLGVIAIPLVEEVQALERSLSSLQSQLQITPTATTSASTTAAPPSTMPTMASRTPVSMVNFSDCQAIVRSQNMSVNGLSLVHISLPFAYFPEFVETTTNRSTVVVEQACWFSHVQGARNLNSYLQFVQFNFTGTPQNVWQCTCSMTSGSGNARCNFYYKECPLATVYV